MSGSRPVSLTFAHPWQRKNEGSEEPYYYNSLTDESEWDKPKELEDVVQSMRLRGDAAGGGKVMRLRSSPRLFGAISFGFV